MNKKIQKKEEYICSICEYKSSSWLGKCPNCNNWDCMVKEMIEANKYIDGDEVEIRKLSAFSQKEDIRLSSGMSEFDRVLGGSEKSKGFIDSQVVLLSGEPGIGKSTLLMQVLFSMVSHNISSLYVSSEESYLQVASRAQRLVKGALISNFESKDLDKIELVSATCLEHIMQVIEKKNPKFLIIDSIQSIYSSNSNGYAGSIAQIRTCCIELVRVAKKRGIIVVIVGHITKEGEIAGPKLLEHLVDTVIQIEGDNIRDYRFMRSLKNRFGPSMEIGIFKMQEAGLVDVLNPYLVDSQHSVSSAGVAKTISIQGVRPMILEIEALVTKTFFPFPKRVAEGISLSRLQRIVAIIAKYTKTNLYDKDVYIKVGGGLRVEDPSIDLAIAISIISSSNSKVVNSDIVSFGELSLSGRVVDVARSSDRIKEIKRLGFRVLSSKDIKSISDQSNLPFVS